jgi:hypothetical protein
MDFLQGKKRNALCGLDGLGVCKVKKGTPYVEVMSGHPFII